VLRRGPATSETSHSVAVYLIIPRLFGLLRSSYAQIGYLDSHAAASIAARLDTGSEVRARVKSVYAPGREGQPSREPDHRVTLSVSHVRFERRVGPIACEESTTLRVCQSLPDSAGQSRATPSSCRPRRGLLVPWSDSSQRSKTAARSESPVARRSVGKDEFGFDEAVDYKATDWREQLVRATPGGIDINFENVGGAIMEAVMARMNHYARMPLCGLISGYNTAEPSSRGEIESRIRSAVAWTSMEAACPKPHQSETRRPTHC